MQTMSTTAPAPQVSDHDRLGLTLFLAIILHGMIILGISFSSSNDSDVNILPTLDIILLQSYTPSETSDADYLAQVSQQGGGENEEKERPSDLFTAPTITKNPGTAVQETRQQISREEQQEQLALLHQADSDYAIDTDKNHSDTDDTTINDLQNSQQSQQVARLAEELDTELKYEANYQKTKYLNSSTKEFVPAQYMHSWISRVERIGNLNYPDLARRQKLNGTLILDVVISADGELVKTDLRRSSGHQLLDDAAIRIVKLAAPYPPFPKKLKEIADVIHITRSWEFLNGSTLRTN